MQILVDHKWDKCQYEAIENSGSQNLSPILTLEVDTEKRHLLIELEHGVISM